LSEGLVTGRIEKSDGVELPREMLVEPLGLGTPGAYVARVASRTFTPGELEELRSLDEGYLGGSNRETGTSGNSERADKVMTVRKGNGARYCVLKVLNTRGQYLELGKKYTLWNAEPLRRIPPEQAGVDFRYPGRKEAADLRVSSVSTRDAQELREVREKLEQKFNHFSEKKKQVFLPVMEESLDLFCCPPRQMAVTRSGQGIPCRFRKTPTVYPMP
jgi:hypothetical protein